MELHMKKTSALSLFTVLILTGTQAFAGITPAPGPEFGEGTMGLLALGISAVAYVAYKFKNKK